MFMWKRFGERADMPNQMKIMLIDRGRGRAQNARTCQAEEAPVGRPVLVHPRTHAQDRASPAEADEGGELAEILFEQLGYLIEHADQERDRLDRVMTY